MKKTKANELVVDHYNISISCGGTHLASPEDTGCIQVSRKNLGKEKARLSCTFDNALFNIEKYHEKEL